MRRWTEPEQSLRIPSGGVVLEGSFALPARARALVVFAHGSGSSLRSSRNRFVAEALQADGLGTLLFDLLTREEVQQDACDGQLRFDIDLLARRLGDVTRWLEQQEATRGMALGYFGASTGAAVALQAAAEHPRAVRAIVARGGRPDLAAGALARVRTPTLLIVGGADERVRLNRLALERIVAPKQLAIVPEATHLFEEPGALEEAARLAGDWFMRYLGDLAVNRLDA